MNFATCHHVNMYLIWHIIQTNMHKYTSNLHNIFFSFAFNPQWLNCFSINCSSFKVSWRWLIVDSSTQTHSLSIFFMSSRWNGKKKNLFLCAMCVLLLKCELELYSFQLLSYVKKRLVGFLKTATWNYLSNLTS